MEHMINVVITVQVENLGSSLTSEEDAVRQEGVDRGAVRTLRLRLLRVVEHAACLASAQSNLPECRQVGLHRQPAF